MKNKVILLTGGAGFIGTKIAERYVQDNKIIIFDTFGRNSIQYSEKLKSNNVTLINGNILDKEHITSVVAEFTPTHVVHLAAIAGVDAVLNQPIETLKVNVIGTYNVIEACNQYANTIERFIDISTSEVFGSYAFKAEESASTNLAPVGEARWTYSISKLVGEHFAHAYYNQFGLKTVSIRPFNVYGPGQICEGAMHRFVTRAINGEPLEIHGEGDQIRSWCYIDDFVDGLCLCLENNEAVGNTFNIGNPRATVTIDMLANMIVEIAHSNSEVVYVPKNYVDVELRIPSIEKSKHILGYSPKVSLTEGLKRTIDWYRLYYTK